MRNSYHRKELNNARQVHVLYYQRLLFTIHSFEGNVIMSVLVEYNN